MTEFHRSSYEDSTSGRSNRNHQEDRNRARQAAEALFAPKRRVVEPASAFPVASTVEAARKPRILSAVPLQPSRAEAAKPSKPSLKAASAKKRVKIPAAHYSRIRTWLKYGMTVSQVAEMYGVAIGEIEEILQKA